MPTSCREELSAVAGLYLNPPDKALVLSVDEQSQIQALNRTQPGSADEEGKLRYAGTRLSAEWHHDTVCGPQQFGSHGDWGMHATASAPRLSDVSGALYREISILDLHEIVDNYGTHKHAKVKSWLRRNPFTFHADELLVAQSPSNDGSQS